MCFKDFRIPPLFYFMAFPVNREIGKTQYFLEDDLRQTSLSAVTFMHVPHIDALSSFKGKVLVDANMLIIAFL